MNEPTDAAIDTLILEHGVMGQAWPTQRQLHAFARAVLAKWGTPAPVGVEPVAWLSTDSIGERYLCFTKPNDSDPVRPLVFGDTAPQPTQAQAGAVPLNWPTNEMIEAGRKAAISHGPLLGGGQSLWHVFRDMLAAAPSPQKQGGQHD